MRKFHKTCRKTTQHSIQTMTTTDTNSIETQISSSRSLPIHNSNFKEPSPKSISCPPILQDGQQIPHSSTTVTFWSLSQKPLGKTHPRSWLESTPTALDEWDPLLVPRYTGTLVKELL
ncbi:hypothetical protein CEXT_334861 [Caerostris extrusa]|uniref:Uncharacterized protein n=1 Tax=Caerostris extrusa TaxID=172846 RepID=A0AAV4UZD5_CAEEX|nr:hypothetical protein CEXT_334861 [Caerostris extrusa]